MIASIRGVVQALSGEAAIVEVGGVGLLVHCTPTTLSQLRMGEQTTLTTSLVVREDALTLYGFLDADERAVFEALQAATGVGPRLAQAVLAVHTPDSVRVAVATGDVHALTRVSGIGTKGAQRMLVELKDRLGPANGVTGAPRLLSLAGEHTGVAGQVRAALLGMGAKPVEADDALRVALADPETPQEAAGLLTAVLQAMDRR